MDFYKQTLVEQDAEMKQNLASDSNKKKKKRKRTPKEPWEPKSKDKQIMSDKPKKCSGKGKRTRVCDIYNDAEDQYMCLERAAFLLERLDAESPKFAKCMLPSNVLYSFWLILPKKFCVMHLPEHDTTVTLVDETGKEFKTNYLKVNIVRRYGLETIEAAVCLMEMHPRVKKTRTSNYFEKAGESKKEKLKHKEAKEDEGKLKNQTPMLIHTKKGKRTRRSPKKFIARLSLDFCERNVEEDGERVSCVDQCENSSDGLSSEVLQGSTLEMTNESQPDEVGCYALNLACHEGINCHSTAERIFHSSTVTT